MEIFQANFDESVSRTEVDEKVLFKWC